MLMLISCLAVKYLCILLKYNKQLLQKCSVYVFVVFFFFLHSGAKVEFFSELNCCICLTALAKPYAAPISVTLCYSKKNSLLLGKLITSS